MTQCIVGAVDLLRKTLQKVSGHAEEGSFVVYLGIFTFQKNRQTRREEDASSVQLNLLGSCRWKNILLTSKWTGSRDCASEHLHQQCLGPGELPFPLRWGKWTNERHVKHYKARELEMYSKTFRRANMSMSNRCIKQKKTNIFCL